MTTTNPFPGMNPFFEQQWLDAHVSLITYMRDILQERLPPDLIARAEEREPVTISTGGKKVTYYPDVQVREPQTLSEPSLAIATPQSPPPATEPIRIFYEEPVVRWLEIHDTTGRLITVLELLSPSNKLGADGRDQYCLKRCQFLSGGANLVEIDLIRKGTWIFPESIRKVLCEARACYGVCVYRAARRGEHEVYPIHLRERLPAIRVPLRPTDADVVLDLQPLINQCHERGRYHFLNYRFDLDPPPSPEEAAWIDQVLRDHHLR